MPEILEIIMILCFGASWPFNVAKSFRARTARGKRLLFLILVEVGYIAGFVQNWLICLPVAILLMVGTLLVIKAITKKKA